jgi:3-phenylpropionate/cinnamic acid dioxygenase small subunit
VRFVLDEAQALNERRYEDWLGLFAERGRYWVPLRGAAQADEPGHASLADEDRLLLAIRIERLKSPRAHSMEPGVASLHVIQTPKIVASDADRNEYMLLTPFTYVERRGGRQQQLAGMWRHRLEWADGALKIVLKRVDLLDAGAAHEAIYLFP